jgi:hypothetical protein
LFCEIWAWAMKFSTDEKPAPIWNVPVGRSLTSTLTSTNSSELPLPVDTSTRSKKPSALIRRLDSSRLDAEYSSPSAIFISRRITLSRVLELPRTLMRSKYAFLPLSISHTSSMVLSFMLGIVIGDTLAYA